MNEGYHNFVSTDEIKASGTNPVVALDIRAIDGFFPK